MALGLTWDQLVALQRGADFIEMVTVARYRPAWHDKAACHDTPANFFPARGESADPAKAVCATCPSQRECLAWALDQDADLGGIWGGTSARERKAIRTGRYRPEAA